MSALPATWAAALEARRRTFDLEAPRRCLRILHTEVPALRCDRFGPVCWFYRYAAGPPEAAAVAAFDALTAAAGARAWHAHGMHDRGRDPATHRHWTSRDAPPSWTADEGGITYQLRAHRGQSPGLFLDQRENRAWVRRHAAGARILNLFAYTGGFGLAALAGGAAQVTQVDLSRAYLDWARANAAANGWSDRAVEYVAVEARLFLRGCRRRGRRFDGVVCDPPSFARAGGRGARSHRLFRVAHDLGDLVRACLEVVGAGGWILVSTNYEGWQQADFEAVVGAHAGGANLTPAPGPGSDFPAAGATPGLHSCILRLG